MDSEARWHLVLGASHGIGLAYAEWYARHGDSLVISARSEADLTCAKERLIRLGAAGVQIVSADLTNVQSRRSLFRHSSGYAIESIFLGGPSPPAGRLDDISSDDVRRACEICLVLPLEVIRWALSRAPCRLVILSSSASTEPVDGHAFFLSALFRRALDELVHCVCISLGTTRFQIHVWRPSVVLTRLSIQYASTLPPVISDDSPVNRLRSAFALSVIPTPEAYVQSQLSSEVQ